MPKFDLVLNAPLMNAAGSMGFSLDPHCPIDTSLFGAFVTNPISIRRRIPAHPPRLMEFPGGLLLHTGYPNQGLKSTIRQHGSRWLRSALPVVVHLLAENPTDLNRMVALLESLEGVLGIELGLPPDADVSLATDLVYAALGELPVIARLPMERALQLAPALADFDLAAISLGPPRGALPTSDGALVHGRLYGPAVFPHALAAVENLVSTGLPVIAAGGIQSTKDAKTMLAAGAIAVQLDILLWRTTYQV
jgi:dihydroorotate dehydrogenase (NAD+) catalytic subunit